MRVVLLNDTRADPNPGCQATVSVLTRQLAVTLGARIRTRPRGEGYDAFAPLVASGQAHDHRAWAAALDVLATDTALVDALDASDLVVANLEGTFHHHTVGALALGATLALAHRRGRPVWALNGTVEAIDGWLLEHALGRAARVSVREPWSARWLNGQGIAATLAADAAFLAAPFMARGSASPESGRVFYTPGVTAGLVASRAEAVAALLADLHAVADTGREPVFAWLEDREAPLAATVAARGWATLDLRQVPWTAIGPCLRTFDLVISGRYHLLVFAAMAGRPFLARPSNTHKIEGLLEHLECDGAMTGDAAALSRQLANGLPRAVAPSTIARCQALARSAVPRSDATSAAPVIEGLDWVPAADLPEVLTTLRRTAPLPLTTSLAVRPWDAGATAIARVASLDEWRGMLGRSGLQLSITGTADVDAPDAGPGRPAWRAPWAETSDARHVVTLSPAAPLPDTPAATRDLVIAAVVGDAADLARLAPVLRAVPPARRRVIVREGAGDPDWAAVRHDVVAWCRSLDADVVLTDAPGVVDWRLPGCPGVLAVHGRPAPERPRTWQAAFCVAARRRGWHPLVVDGDGDTALPAADRPAAPGTTDGPVRIALFGASSLGRRKAAQVRARPGLALIGVFDNDPAKWHSTFEGVPVLRPEPAAFASADLIVLASMHEHAIARQVIEAGFGQALVMDLPASA